MTVNFNLQVSALNSAPVSVYYGFDNANIPPALLTLPNDVLNLIAEKLEEQSSIIPLRFVCKRIANLNKVKTKKASNTLIRSAAEDAIALGSLSLVAWYHDRLRHPHIDWTMSGYLASGWGRLPILQWAHANGCPWTEGTCHAAADHGRLEILQWAYANGCPLYEGDGTQQFEAFGPDNKSIYSSARGHPHVIEWLRSIRCPGENYHHFNCSIS